MRHREQEIAVSLRGVSVGDSAVSSGVVGHAMASCGAWRLRDRLGTFLLNDPVDIGELLSRKLRPPFAQ